ncbi:hypothetical protein EYW49_04485 [Siculibacillus lacustris]|uniref:Uncharacterized protein n=1 Tax=Siculibacillus lacustris TaxID=1549641 RepID=A0A4Q9VVZ1_9HYPH|nr:hypothetical protein [Siculibacillus lacustris]TBW40442.1 hypothetical protein EYW49_04485 [Siculibacillus lacustris]
MNDSRDNGPQDREDPRRNKLLRRLKRYARDRGSLIRAYADLVAGSVRRSPLWRAITAGNLGEIWASFSDWLNRRLTPEQRTLLFDVVCVRGRYCERKKGYKLLAEAAAVIWDIWGDERSGTLIHIAIGIAFGFFDKFCGCDSMAAAGALVA